MYEYCVYVPDCFEGRLIHGCHAGAVVFAGEASDVHLQRYGPHGRPEIEQPNLRTGSRASIISGIFRDIF